MKLQRLRLLFDCGLFVLIWIVQLIIYPGFQYYSAENLGKWHEDYTVFISWIVIPLMFGQLITAAMQLLRERNSFTMGSSLLIVLVWICTFSLFVPIHHSITEGLATEILLQELISKNWIRTVLWTVLFMWSFVKTIYTES